ncbi:MAG TPA: acyloxyacyl hydrolase [Nitrospiraceae bacterium]|nr:acyloxyacyl hydrolase [Nitrospiraceae bacterium]
MLRHRRLRNVLLLLVHIALWSLADVSVSKAAEEARDVVKKGTIEVGLAGGFWQATTVIGDAPSANRNAAFVLPRLGMVLTDTLGSKWWQGNVEVLVEPLYAKFIRPFEAEAAGGSLVLKYNFLSFGRWMPFWDAGAGMAWTDLAPRIPEESTQFQFILETGPGVHYFVTNRVTLTTGIRFHHISNGGLGERNTGLNAGLAYVGLSIFLPE